MDMQYILLSHGKVENNILCHGNNQSNEWIDIKPYLIISNISGKPTQLLVMHSFDIVLATHPA